jgi:hypothetical protein
VLMLLLRFGGLRGLLDILRGEREEGEGDGDGNELRDSESCVGTEKRKKITNSYSITSIIESLRRSLALD